MRRAFRPFMAASVAPGPLLRLGPPRRLFDFHNAELGFGCTPTRCYEVDANGRRFYVLRPAAPPPPPPVVTHINLIQNWFGELKAKVPGGP